MWQLRMIDAQGKAETIGSFDSIAEAARRIIALEAYSVSGVFFDVLIETGAGEEKEALGHLEHTGLCTNRCYVVKKLAH